MHPTTTFAWYPVITCHTWVTTENKQCAKNYGANSCLCTQFEYGCTRALHTYASVGSYTRGAGAESYVTKWTALVIMMSASCMTQISTFLGIPKQTT